MKNKELSKTESAKKLLADLKKTYKPIYDKFDKLFKIRNFKYDTETAFNVVYCHIRGEAYGNSPLPHIVRNMLEVDCGIYLTVTEIKEIYQQCVS